MRLSRWACLLIVLPAALFSASCGDDGKNTGNGGSSGAGASSSAGTTPGGASSVAGSASSGASVGGSGGSAGTSSVSGSAGASGTGGGGGSGRIFTVRPDFCQPYCAETDGYCALVDRGGCSTGKTPCVVEAECRPYEACVLTAPDFKCGPSDCRDNTKDTCKDPGCPGFCICMLKSCPDGQAFDENAAVCACVPAVTPPLDCADIDCPEGTDCETVLDSAVCVKRFTH